MLTENQSEMKSKTISRNISTERINPLAANGFIDASEN